MNCRHLKNETWTCEPKSSNKIRMRNIIANEVAIIPALSKVTLKGGTTVLKGTSGDIVTSPQYNGHKLHCTIENNELTCKELTAQGNPWKPLD